MTDSDIHSSACQSFRVYDPSFLTSPRPGSATWATPSAVPAVPTWACRHSSLARRSSSLSGSLMPTPDELMYYSSLQPTPRRPALSVWSQYVPYRRQRALLAVVTAAQVRGQSGCSVLIDLRAISVKMQSVRVQPVSGYVCYIPSVGRPRRVGCRLVNDAVCKESVHQ